MHTSTTQPVETKYCPRCATIKRADQFQSDPRHSDRLQSICSTCQVEYTRERRQRIRQDTERYQRYLEQRREEKRRYRLRKRLRELAALATPEPLPQLT